VAKFQKGHPRFGGRKKDVLTRGQVKVQQLARDLFSDPAYLANLRERLVRGRCAPQVECKLYAYAFGEPPQRVAIDGAVSSAWCMSTSSAFELAPLPSVPAASDPDVH
jgi:hypothetical protein